MIKLLVVMQATGSKCGPCDMQDRKFHPITNKVLKVSCKLFSEDVSGGTRCEKCKQAQLNLEKAINKAVANATTPEY